MVSSYPLSCESATARAPRPPFLSLSHTRCCDTRNSSTAARTLTLRQLPLTLSPAFHTRALCSGQLAEPPGHPGGVRRVHVLSLASYTHPHELSQLPSCGLHRPLHFDCDGAPLLAVPATRPFVASHTTRILSHPSPTALSEAQLNLCFATYFT